MSAVIAEPRESPPVDRVSASARDSLWYAAAVLVGTVLAVVAAVNQPFNQNELLQMAPYGSDSLSEIISGTRQPPLDPLLSALVQHLMGEGQFRQRLVPVLAGVGTLALTALLLRRLRLGLAGAFALAVMATAPLFVRYTAYSRPYALPLFFTMVFVVAAQQWLDTGRRRWLVLAAAAAAALPASRVPEATAFLLMTSLAMATLGLRRRLAWNRAGPLLVLPLLALAAVGYPMIRSLQSQTPTLWDGDGRNIADRFAAGIHELVTGFLPLMSTWLPVWPAVLLVAVGVLAIPDARRRVLGWWFFWPLAAAPLAFALAYHFVLAINFDTLPYRARAAYFFVPSLALLVAALAKTAMYARGWPTWVRGAVGLVLVATLIGQIPATVRVATEPDVPDFGAAGRLVEDHVPADAVVLFDTVAGVGEARRGFLAKPRYLDDPDRVVEVDWLLKKSASLPADAPVYLLVNGRCTHQGCVASTVLWRDPVDGMRLVATADRFALYAPAAGQTGPAGAALALEALSHSLGPDFGYLDAFAAAVLRRREGGDDEARAIIRQLYSAAGPQLADKIREWARPRDLVPAD